MPVPQKPTAAFRIPGHPFWALGCKGLLSAHEGTGTPQVIQAGGAKANVSYTDGTTAGTTDPTWTTDALSSPASNAIALADTGRQIVATGCSTGTGNNAWTIWGTIRFTAANRNSVPIDTSPGNANAIKIRLGTARLMYLSLWQNIRNFGTTLVDGHCYSFMATVVNYGSNNIDADLYLYDHDTGVESTPAHFDLTHGSVPEAGDAPIINSRSVAGLTTSVGVVGNILDMGWASNATLTVATLSDFRAYYADPAAPWRASLQASPTSLPPDTANQDVALTGNTAGWSAGTPGTPTFNLGATNATKVSQVVTTTTAASIRISTGASETLLITDAVTGASVNLPVSAAGATGYSFTGPTSGTVGLASTNFTVALTGGTVPSPNPVTITPSDGGGGGTFTPTSVQLSNSVTSATFTYTAGSAGTKTLSVSDNGAYTDPASISYVASVGGLSSGTLALGTPTRATVNISSTGAASGGQAPIAYQWEKSDTYGGTYAPISGATSAGLSGHPLGGYNKVGFFRRRATDALDNTVVTSVLPASTMPTEVLGVALFGSSSTEGMTHDNVRAALAANMGTRFSNVVITNRGVGGTETMHWLPPGHTNAGGTQRMATALTTCVADLATATLRVASCWIGVNDARTNSRAVDWVMGNIRDIGKFLTNTYEGATNSTFVFDLVVFPGFNFFLVPTGGSAASLALVQGYNAALPATIAAMDPTRHFLGHTTWFATEVNNPALIDGADGIHNVPAGYRILENLTAHAIAKAVLQFGSPELSTATTTVRSYRRPSRSR